MSPSPAFALIETLAVIDGAARHLDRHLARLERSARELGFVCDGDRVRRGLGEVEGTCIARVQLEADGSFAITERPLTPPDGPVRLMIDSVLVDPDAVAVRHKTTDRAHLVAAKVRHPGADDVIVLGRDGRVAESTIANVAARIGGRWVTPPVSDGCLPGIGREIALEAGDVVERPISVDELRSAEAIALISSVRGWREAVIA